METFTPAHKITGMSSPAERRPVLPGNPVSQAGGGEKMKAGGGCYRNGRFQKADSGGETLTTG